MFLFLIDISATEGWGGETGRMGRRVRKDGEEYVRKDGEESEEGWGGVFEEGWGGVCEEGMGYTYQQVKMLLPPLVWYSWKHSIV